MSVFLYKNWNFGFFEKNERARNSGPTLLLGNVKLWSKVVEKPHVLTLLLSPSTHCIHFFISTASVSISVFDLDESQIQPAFISFWYYVWYASDRQEVKVGLGRSGSGKVECRYWKSLEMVQTKDKKIIFDCFSDYLLRRMSLSFNFLIHHRPVLLKIQYTRIPRKRGQKTYKMQVKFY